MDSDGLPNEDDFDGHQGLLDRIARDGREAVAEQIAALTPPDFAHVEQHHGSLYLQATMCIDLVLDALQAGQVVEVFETDNPAPPKPARRTKAQRVVAIEEHWAETDDQLIFATVLRNNSSDENAVNTAVKVTLLDDTGCVIHTHEEHTYIIGPGMETVVIARVPDPDSKVQSMKTSIKVQSYQPDEARSPGGGFVFEDVSSVHKDDVVRTSGVVRHEPGYGSSSVEIRALNHENGELVGVGSTWLQFVPTRNVGFVVEAGAASDGSVETSLFAARVDRSTFGTGWNVSAYDGGDIDVVHAGFSRRPDGSATSAIVYRSNDGCDHIVWPHLNGL